MTDGIAGIFLPRNEQFFNETGRDWKSNCLDFN
jgi:hypothetical protein